MLLDNYIVVHRNGEELDHMTAETTCFGAHLPKSWLCCFTEDDALIENDELLLETSIKLTKKHLRRVIHFLLETNRHLKSRFAETMVEEFFTTLNWLEKFNDDDIVSVSFGCYGDIVSLEKFKKQCGAGKLTEYGSEEVLFAN